MIRLFYNLLFPLALLFFLPGYIVKMCRRGNYRNKFGQRLGFYDPKAPEGRESLRVNLERVKHWQGKGAQLSPTAKRLVKQFAKKAA